MCHPTHGLMFIMHASVEVVGEYGGEEFMKEKIELDSQNEISNGGDNFEGQCFMETTSKSLLMMLVLYLNDLLT